MKRGREDFFKGEFIFSVHGSVGSPYVCANGSWRLGYEYNLVYVGVYTAVYCESTVHKPATPEKRSTNAVQPVIYSE